MSLGFARRVLGAATLCLAGLDASPALAADTPVEGTESPATAPEATAAGESRARAQAIFEEALSLARGGDYAAACVKLEESLAVHDGIGTSFHLAGCWQRLGRTASAYRLFAKVADRAHGLGQKEREEAARARMKKLEPELSRMRIEVTSQASKLEILRDAELVPESEWGKGIAVDPGKHEVCARAQGKEPWSSTLEVTEPAVTVAVVVPKLADSAPAAPPVTSAGEAPSATPSPEPEAEPSAANNPTKTVAMIVGGVGLAALGAGLLEGAQFLHSNREAKGICPSGTNCTSEEITRHEDAVRTARTSRTWAYVGIGGGGVAVAVAAYMFLSAPSESKRADRSKSLALIPVAGPDTWGGVLQGGF